MIFLTYRIRDGAVADGYHDWLRSIDNPFFNAIPGIKCYTNWKVHGSLSALPFTHFDFLEIDEVDQLELLWFNPELNSFRTEWCACGGATCPILIMRFATYASQAPAARRRKRTSCWNLGRVVGRKTARGPRENCFISTIPWAPARLGEQLISKMPLRGSRTSMSIILLLLW